MGVEKLFVKDSRPDFIVASLAPWLGAYAPALSARLYSKTFDQFRSALQSAYGWPVPESIATEAEAKQLACLIRAIRENPEVF